MPDDLTIDEFLKDGEGDNTPSGDEELNDFFAQLDNSINSGMISSSLSADNNAKKKKDDKKSSDGVSKSSPQGEDVESLKKELETLRKRYGDSSAEAKRLAQRLKKLEEYEGYIPILEQMRSDPQLINHVRKYLEGAEVPTNLQEELGLGDDFSFDFEEAIRDPNSPSGRLYQASIDRVVQKRIESLRQAEAQRAFAEEQEKAVREFRKKYNVSDEEFEDIVSWAKNHRLSMEDIYYLKNREARERELLKRAAKDREKQVKMVKDIPRSLASVGGVRDDSGEGIDEMVFKRVKEAIDGGSLFDK